MTGFVIKDNEGGDVSYCSIAKERRKKMKVAVERRRRDRINRALESLRHLLAEDLHSDVEADQVIDKAVILEKTVQLLQRNRSNFSQLQGTSQVKLPQNHYSAGYIECLEQINNATNKCYMDSNIKSRLLHHLTRSQNVRMSPYIKKSQQEICVSSAATISVPHGHPATRGTPASRPTSRSSRASPVNSQYSQFYVNTDSSAQDCYSGEVRAVGLLQKESSSTAHLPANVPPRGSNVRAMQAVDENNNNVNPAVPGPVSSSVWRPW